MKRNTRKTVEDVQATTVREVENPSDIVVARRNCWAMERLITEVHDIDLGIEVTPNNCDTTGAYLDVLLSGFDENLIRAIGLIDHDDRVDYVIAGADDMDGSVYVAFVADPVLKDSRGPFGLAEALAVLA